MLVGRDPSIDNDFVSELEHLVVLAVPTAGVEDPADPPIDWSGRGISIVESARVERLTGALMAAMERRSFKSGRISASGNRTASMAPTACACTNSARRATSINAVSNGNTPERHPATYSPTLCPIMTDG